MSAPTPTIKKNEPFAKLAHRKTTAAAAIAAENDGTNPWTSPPRERTARYFTIREQARKLPAALKREDFIHLYQRAQVIILTGDADSGKTTQIPQYIMYSDLPRYQGKKIVCTQPRRVAAKEVARRVAEELDVTLGEEVGYEFRYEEVTGLLTRVVYTTEGRLLQEIASDPTLDKYSCIVLDEAHERSESIDLLMGLIKPVLKQRRDLKLIVMSATMRTDVFSKHFNEAERFKIEGRTYGYSVLWASFGEERLLTCVDYVAATVLTVKNIVVHRIGEDPHTNMGDPDDILVFVPGEDDIKQIIAGIEHELPAAAVSVVGLHGSMSKEAQEKALAPKTGSLRKCIVATSIAETSLTIDGIVHVIDTGLTKGMLYNPRLNLWTLSVEPIPQAAADQRAERAGRTREGKCWRLYSKQAYDTVLIKDPLPALLRSDMMGSILDIVAIGRNPSAANIWTFMMSSSLARYTMNIEMSISPS